MTQQNFKKNGSLKELWLVTKIVSPLNIDVFEIAWAPDGYHLASCGVDTDIYIWNINQTSKIAQLTFRSYSHSKRTWKIHKWTCVWPNWKISSLLIKLGQNSNHMEDHGQLLKVCQIDYLQRWIFVELDLKLKCMIGLVSWWLLFNCNFRVCWWNVYISFDYLNKLENWRAFERSRKVSEYCKV